MFLPQREVIEKSVVWLDGVMKNKEMILMVVAFALTILVVYAVRRMSVDHSWSIAIGVGAVTDLIMILVGGMLLHVSVKLLPVLLGSVISAVIVLVLQMTLFNLDYSRTEYVQFEDDEYYYYVKAVPKVTIAVPEKKVKKISVQKKSAAGRKKSSAAKKQAPHQNHSHKE